jgi:hypothetical protein
LESAAEALLAAGDEEAAAEAHAFLTEALHLQGRGVAAYSHMERALELARDAAPSAAKVRVLTESSRLLARAESGDAPVVAQEAYDMAMALGLSDLASRALTNRGLSKVNAFDPDGAIADFELSIELARSVNSPEEGRARHNLGSATWFRGELAPRPLTSPRRPASESVSGKSCSRAAPFSAELCIREAPGKRRSRSQTSSSENSGAPGQAISSTTREPPARASRLPVATTSVHS